MIHLRFVSIRVSIATQRRLFQNAKEAERRATSNNKNLQLDRLLYTIAIAIAAQSWAGSCRLIEKAPDFGSVDVGANPTMI